MSTSKEMPKYRCHKEVWALKIAEVDAFTLRFTDESYEPIYVGPQFVDKYSPKRRDLHNKDFYICAPCDAYVGCHMNTITPLGRLANTELRAAKSAAHRAFDTKWQGGGMTRKQAYRWLSVQLGILPELCHIGMFDVETCQRVVALCSGDDFDVVV